MTAVGGAGHPTASHDTVGQSPQACDPGPVAQARRTNHGNPVARGSNLATSYQEHAAKLSTYLRAALSSIDANERATDPHRVKHAIFGVLSLVIKVQVAPDLKHIQEAIHITQNEAKIAAENTNKSYQ